MKHPYLANAALMLCVLAWGAPIPLIGDLLQRWDPMLFAVARFWVAVPCLALLWLALRTKGERFVPLGVRRWPILRLTLIGIVGFGISYSYAYDYLNPVMAAVISAASPLVGAVVARLLFQVRLAPGFAVAILLSLVGGALVAVNFAEWSLELRGGELLLLLAIAIWAWYSLELQRVLPNITQLHATLLTTWPAALILPVIYLASWAVGLSEGPPAAEALLMRDFLLIAWCGVMGIAAAIVCWNQGVKWAGLIYASLYLNLTPVVAIISALVLGVVPRWLQLLGILVAIAGVVYAQLKRRRAIRADLSVQPLSAG